jgi:hypothetical protein
MLLEVLVDIPLLILQRRDLISATHPHSQWPILGNTTKKVEEGQHSLVSRTLKGIFHKRPPQPRYSESWDVSTVTSYIESLDENDSLCLASLTHKSVALTRPSTSADVSQLDLRFRRYLPVGVSKVG